MTQRALALRHEVIIDFPAYQTPQERKYRRSIRQLKKILGTLKEIQVIYQKILSGIKSLFSTTKKSVYVLKERSLLTAETQISGLEEHVEKNISKHRANNMRGRNSEENMRLGE